MSRVGEKIQKLRTQAGMTQKNLAKKVGVSEGFIKEVESGKKIINQTMLDKISTLLGKNIDDLVISFEEEIHEEPQQGNDSFKEQGSIKAKKPNEAWVNALGSVLRKVPVYRYNLSDVVATKDLPVISNKIEGHAPDKVFYIEIENDDMIGFRMEKGDLALCYTTHEIENNAFCLVNYEKGLAVRQIKRLDANKVLLLSNKGRLITETVDIKSIRVLAKLEKLEIKL